MGLYDDASLVMIPSGYKDDKLYSIKPTSGDGDFTFSRDGSGASPATRVNSAGLIEKGRTNLLLQSNNFDTTWTNNGTTETGGQSGYDGSSDAWLLEKSNAGGSIRQSIVFNGVGTYSIYAKAGTLNYMLLYLNYGSGTDTQAYFDLSSGSVGTTTAEIDANIESVGSGWYRCSVTFNTPSATATILAFPADADNDTSGTSGNIYIQDAQLEKGLVATSYIETTTAAASAGILGDMPRLDYSGGATCPSLLLEPARTNLLTQSEYLAAYGVTGTGTITTNSDISPEGVQNAFTMTDNDSGNYYRLTSDGMSFNGNPYTMSCFVKKTTGTPSNYPAFEIGALGTYLSIDTTNGVAQETSGGPNYSNINVESYGDYWRVSATCTPAAGTQFLRIWPALGSTLGAVNANATGSATFYGFQIESGSYPTSYVPTYGSATARAVDAMANLDIPNFNNDTSFSVFLELTRNGISGSEIGSMFSFYNDSSTQQFWFHIDAPSAQVRLRDATNSNATMASISFDTYDRKKIAFSCDGSTLKTYADGVLSNTYNLVNVFNLDELRTNAKSFDVHQMVIFPTALTDAELATLTTL